MLSVQIGKETIRFKDNFEEVTVKIFAEHIDKENEIDKVLKQIEDMKKNVADFEAVLNPNKSQEGEQSGNSEQITAKAKEEIIREVSYLEADILEKSHFVTMLRISQISQLTDNPKKTERFLSTTKGIDSGVLSKIYLKIQDGFGDFLFYFQNLKAVKSFGFKDFRRHGIFRRKKCIFRVSDLDRQTVIRDAGATIVAQKIGMFAKQFQSNNWKNFARFVAYVARPKKEEFEYFPRRRFRSFIGGKWFEQMSASDRLTTYNKKLEEAVEARTTIFEDLPISVAIGIYKYYFFLKKNFRKPTANFMESQIRKQQKQRSRI